MPQRSKIIMLPPEIKAELDRRIVAGNFAGYEVMAEWVNEQLRDCGLEITISRSAVHRYGQQFGERLAAIKIATEQARAITEAVGDEEGVMGDALTRLCQEKAFKVLIDMTDPDPESVDLNKMGVMISRLNRAGIMQKKWMAEVRVKAKITADEVVKVAKTGGLSEEKAEDIRRKILGIV